MTYPDGSKVDFNRTNRSLYTLKEYDHYPFRMLDPKEMAGLKILDFGCGDGDVVNTLRRFGVDAFGLDIYLTPKQRKKTYFTMADGQRTPYPDNQFDIVMSTWSAFTYLMYDAGNGKIGAHENAVAILQEMIRITKKGGVIRISPAPHIRTSEGVEFPAVEKILRENFPEVRIKSRPSPEWLQRFHAPPGSHKLGNLYEAPSEVWIELEKIP